MLDFIASLDLDILREDLSSATAGVVVFLATLILTKPLAYLLTRYLKRALKFSNLDLAHEIVERSKGPIFYIIFALGIYLSIKIILLPTEVEFFVERMLKTIITFSLFTVLFRSIDPFGIFFRRLDEVFDRRSSRDIQFIVQKILKSLVIFVAIISVLQIWNINVIAFLGGLGIAGIAVALAAQDTLKNLFGSLTILLDRTFSRGDYILTKDVEGTVEYIGTRTTTIRSPDRAQLFVPNSQLMNSSITNYSRRPNRRIRWRIALPNNIPTKTLMALMEDLRKILDTTDSIQDDPEGRSNIIALEEFEEGTIKLFCQFFSVEPSLYDTLQMRQEVVLQFLTTFEKHGVQMAHPTSYVKMENVG
ncbi:MAG: mechanosensitive ion channel family protein [Alphaproteobacteria bacterium]